MTEDRWRSGTTTDPPPRLTKRGCGSRTSSGGSLSRRTILSAGRPCSSASSGAGWARARPAAGPPPHPPRSTPPPPPTSRPPDIPLGRLLLHPLSSPLLHLGDLLRRLGQVVVLRVMLRPAPLALEAPTLLSTVIGRERLLHRRQLFVLRRPLTSLVLHPVALRAL